MANSMENVINQHNVPSDVFPTETSKNEYIELQVKFREKHQNRFGSHSEDDLSSEDDPSSEDSIGNNLDF